MELLFSPSAALTSSNTHYACILLVEIHAKKSGYDRKRSVQKVCKLVRTGHLECNSTNENALRLSDS